MDKEAGCRDLIGWFELVVLVNHANIFYHISSEEAGLHWAEIARDMWELGYRKIEGEQLTKKEIDHILATQDNLCNLGKLGDDDGSCSVCRSIILKLKGKGFRY